MDEIQTVDFSSLSLSIDEDKLIEIDLKIAGDEIMSAFNATGIVRLSNAGLNDQLVRHVCVCVMYDYDLHVHCVSKTL